MAVLDSIVVTVAVNGCVGDVKDACQLGVADVHWSASDCQALLDRYAGPAHGFAEADKFLDALDEVHSQL